MSTIFSRRDIFPSAKPAAICIAPVTLANAGVLKGKQATCFPSLQKQLTMQGTRVVKPDVVQDGKLLTATGPKWHGNLPRHW